MEKILETETNLQILPIFKGALKAPAREARLKFFGLQEFDFKGIVSGEWQEVHDIRLSLFWFPG